MAKPSVGIVFDADMGNSIDDALALALLYGIESKSEARVVSLSTTKSTLKSAAFLEALQKFFFGRPLPVGMPETGKDTRVTPMLAAVADKYPNTIKQLNDTADPAPAIRNAFTAHHDGNCIVLLAGPATNLASALALPRVWEPALRQEDAERRARIPTLSRLPREARAGHDSRFPARSAPL